MGRGVVYTLAPVALAAALLTLLLTPVTPDPWKEKGPAEDNEYELDDSWYNSAELPDVDLEGLVANLSKQISWFKYVGNATLECSNKAKQEDTLMLAIENLHGCLERHYQECASQFANQTGCEEEHDTEQPCGTFRLGYRGIGDNNYHPGGECTWILTVPEQFFLNLTIDEFFMESSGPGCPYDWMMIYDGHSRNNISARRWGKFCGRLPRWTVYATGKYMMIVAKTDGSIGKEGFRGVYQVMDPHIGITGVEPIRFDFIDKGNFELADKPWVVYDTYYTAYYYWYWHIRVHWSQKIKLTIEHSNLGNDTLEIFEGPFTRNYLQRVISENTAPSVIHTSHGFLLTVRLKRRYDENVTRPNIKGSFEAEDQDLGQLKLEMNNRSREGCTSLQSKGDDKFAKKGDIELSGTTTGDNPAKIAVKGGRAGDHAYMAPRGFPILCHWEITSPADFFIRMKVTSIKVNTANGDRCNYEGLMIWDAANMNIDTMSIGPFCYTEPMGIFEGNSVNTIVSSGKKMWVFYYSYQGYDVKDRLPRGEFSADVSITSCQGLWQPCLGGVPDKQMPNYVNMNKTGVVGKTSYVQVSCDRERCCHIQQFPIYARMPQPLCKIGVITKGPAWIATSKIESSIVQPDKEGTEMHYECEVPNHPKDDISDKLGKGARYLCKGTNAAVEFQSDSPFSMSAFTISVEMNKNDYYDSERHKLNDRYRDGLVILRLEDETKVHTVNFIDHEAVDSSLDRYYEFLVDWSADAKCPERMKGCVQEEFALFWEDKYSIQWTKFDDRKPSDNPKLEPVFDKIPLVYREWGEKGWKRTMKVTRRVDKKCLAEHNLADLSATKKNPEACNVKVTFTKKNFTELMSVNKRVECPDGYDQIGSSCLKLLWPEEGKRLPEGHTMSIQDARKKCKEDNDGSDLLSMHFKHELYDLRMHMYYTWWEKYLRYVPGHKVFAIGAKFDKELNRYQWTTGEPVTFTAWSVPDYKKRQPDKATDWYKPDDVVPSVRPEALAEELNHIQPRSPVDGDCSVMVAFSAFEDAKWVKAKCDMQIPNLMPLCEIPNIPPKNLEDELSPLTRLGVPAEEVQDYRTRVEKDDKGHKLIGTKYECPTGFTMVGKKCLGVVTKSGKQTEAVGKSVPKSDCSKQFKNAAAHGAVLNDDYVNEVMSSALHSWLISEKHGRLRVIKGDPNTAADNNKVACHILEPTAAPKGGEGRPNTTEWAMFLSTDPTCVNDGDTTSTSAHTHANGFLCETPPVLSVKAECEPHQHMCDDGMCIMRYDVCDGHKDCLDGEDERKCGHVCKLKDGFTQSLSTSVKKKGAFCFTEECQKNNCTCDELYFQCRSGGCVAVTKVCDYVEHCSDGSDEELCRKCANPDQDGKCPDKSWVQKCEDLPKPGGEPEEKIKQFRCASSQCILLENKCDYKVDCIDGSDEIGCDFDNHCPSGENVKSDIYHSCKTGKCIAQKYKNDGYPDCPNTNDDELGFLAKFRSALVNRKTGLVHLKALTMENSCTGLTSDCNSYQKKCVERKDTCLYRRDRIGKLEGCRSAAHLNLECKNRICAGMYKCPMSYCITLQQVCDGVSDCMNGEDEKKCENLYCPGMYKCKGTSSCIRQSQVCDKEVHCPRHHDDEALCVYEGETRIKCPKGCTCLGEAVSCIGQGIKDMFKKDELFPGTRALIMRRNKINLFLDREFTAKKLHRFDLSFNKIQGMGEGVFKGMRMLIELYLHNNELSSISREFFTELHYLKVLTVYNNEISHITMDAFNGLKSLPELNLAEQQLRTLEDYHFAGLDSIEVLNISHNRIQNLRENCFSNKKEGASTGLPFYKMKYLNIEGNEIMSESKEAFQFLPPDTHLVSDRFKYCCFARHIRKCDPEPDEFSSCENLIANRVLKIAIWAIGILAFAGNILVLHQRMKHERETTPSLLVQHLAFSDAVMGVYVLIIAGADQYHKDVYIDRADDWRSNALCKLAGFLSMLSCEMSVYLLMLITVDRMYATVPSLNSTGIGVRGVRGLIALGWTFAAIISVVPILEFNYFGSGFIRSGVCTLFNLTEGQISGWEFTVGVFIGFNFIAILTMAVGYFRAYRSYMEGVEDWPMAEELTDEEKEAEIEFRKNEMIITRRLILMVLTDIAIWLPLILVGAGTFIGLKLSKPLSAWITMFFMPLNAAINPYLYTFSTQPHRIPIDDLLRNWTETEYDDEDEFDQAGRFETELGESTLGGSTLSTNLKTAAGAKEKEAAGKTTAATGKPDKPINPEKPPII